MEFGVGGKSLLMLAAAVVVIAGMKAASPILIPFFLAVFIAIATLPIVDWLSQRRVPRGLAVAIAIALDITVLVGFGLLVFDSVNALTEQLPYYQDRFSALLEDSTAWLSGKGFRVSTRTLSKVVDPAWAVNMAAEAVRQAAGITTLFVLVLLILMFALIEASFFADKLRRSFKLTDSDLEAATRATFQVQRYLRIKTTSSVLTGALVGIIVFAADLDAPILWMLLAFLLNYIPSLGSIIASVPAIVLALLQHGLQTSMYVALAYLLVNFTIGNFIEPRLFGRAAGLSPLIVFLSMVLWGWVLGPIGALLSVPLTMMVRILLANTEDLRWLAVLMGPAGKRSSEDLKLVLIEHE